MLSKSYQWQKNSVNISGANSITYTTDAVGSLDDGSVYRCVVSTSSGSSTSNGAVLHVTPLGDRVKNGQQVLYKFQEGSGNVLYDSSEAGASLNLTIFSPAAVQWTPFGLNVNSEATIVSTSSASKIYNACTLSNEITVEAWIQPANITQSGPARIVSYSENSGKRNFTLGQSTDKYNFRLKTTSTDDNGEPSVSTPSGTGKVELTHVVYTRDSGGNVKFYVNGVLETSSTVAGDFSGWNSGYLFSLANEITDSRPWTGLLNLVAVFERALSPSEVLRNYNFGAIGVTEIVAPSNLTANATVFGQIELSWDDNSNNEDAFVIERGEGSPVVYSVIDTVSANTVSYTDMNLPEGKTYTYRISAYNLVSTSLYSNLSTESTILVSPSGLAAEAVTVGEVNLNWADNSNFEDGYIIERKELLASTFNVIDSSAANDTMYTDNTVDEALTYVYRIMGYSATSFSGYSNVDTVTTLFSDINAPTDLTANAIAIGQIELNWTDNSAHENGFIVERGEGTPLVYTVLDSVGHNITTYLDTCMDENT